MRTTLIHKTRINGFVGILVIIGTLSPFPHLLISIFDVFIKIHDIQTSRHPKQGQLEVVFNKTHDENDFLVFHSLSFPWLLGANSKVIHVFLQRQFYNLIIVELHTEFENSFSKKLKLNHYT